MISGHQQLVFIFTTRTQTHALHHVILCVTLDTTFLRYQSWVHFHLHNFMSNNKQGINLCVLKMNVCIYTIYKLWCFYNPSINKRATMALYHSPVSNDKQWKHKKFLFVFFSFLTLCLMKWPVGRANFDPVIMTGTNREEVFKTIKHT